MQRVQRRLVLALVVGALASFAASSAADACSYAGDDRPYAEVLRAQFRAADAAFIGRLIAIAPLDDLGDGTPSSGIHVFLVERRLKGRLRKLVPVYASIGSNLCGLELERGDRIGLLLDRRGRRWTSHSLLQVSPRDLLRAARSKRRK